MDEEIERLVIGVRADTAGFARDVETMRGQIEGPLATGATRAARGLEQALGEAVRRGKIGFDELRGVALSAMDAVARAALRDGVRSVVGGGVAGGMLTALLGGLLGLSGHRHAHASGGRGADAGAPPRWPGPGGALPGADGSDGGNGARGVGARGALHLAISVHAAAGEAPRALERSARQVARAVRAALEEAE
ncbi:tail tape measure protein [Sphingomonas sp. BK235]|uniref:tail tape measure protein n=1 Tax=Sphingomonas sp. BK235 TaxID=2512131 RepID=UPI00104F28F5|nr:tail tape measure protein [Sphingomonas sp. BK235]TCP33610.1 hypothetical protein EV292_10557 [Sphingomonas sp. BK235]